MTDKPRLDDRVVPVTLTPREAMSLALLSRFTVALVHMQMENQGYDTCRANDPFASWEEEAGYLKTALKAYLPDPHTLLDIAANLADRTPEDLADAD